MNSMIKMELDEYSARDNSQFFDIYHRNIFKEAPRTTWINGWKVEYMAIASLEAPEQVPTLIVGGAFQNFNSYKYCVEQLFEKGPVILVDLPSLGSNQQIQNIETGVSAGSLELPELSEMLGQWLDIVGVQKVSVMGMSLGSVVASCFASLRPELVDRLILMGVMQKTRKSWRMLLEESLTLMQEQRMDEFGQAVILYLVNHAKLDQTRMSPTAKRLFYKQMSEFDIAERERYEINCNRLLRLSHVPIPPCKTLVACGQYDSFTLPFENANFALQCPDVEFAMIANADHVPQLQRRKETMNLFSSFLKGQSIHDLDGILNLDREQMQQLNRRGEERFKILDKHTTLEHGSNKKRLNIEIKDVNYFGAAFYVEDTSQLDYIDQNAKEFSIQLKDEQGEFGVNCLVFECVKNEIRVLFKHGNFEIAERLLNFIESQKIYNV